MESEKQGANQSLHTSMVSEKCGVLQGSKKSERYLRDRDEILARKKAKREQSKLRQPGSVIPILPKPAIVSPQTSLDIADQTATAPPIKQETLFDEISGISLESFNEEPQISLEDFIGVPQTSLDIADQNSNSTTD